MIERVKKYSWYVFVFLLPWQTAWILREVFVAGEKWQYATVGLYVSDVALLVSMAFFVATFRREVWGEMWRDMILWILAALCVWTSLSALWAIDGSLALFSAWRMFLMTLLYVLVRYGGFPIRKTLLVFLVSMTLHAVLAISQWVGQYVSPSTFLGIAEHDPARWGTFVLKTESGRFLRAYGGFEHPNVLGGALAIAILCGVWLSVTADHFRSRIALLAMALLMSFALVFTFSRSGWIAFLFGALVIGIFVLLSFFQRVRRSKKRIFLTHSSRVGAKFRKILFFDLLGTSLVENVRFLYRKNVYRFFMALLLTGVSFLTAFFLVCDVAMSRFSGETLAREGSFSDRAVLMDQGFATIRERPILGVGSGNFTAFTQGRFPEAGRFVGDFQPVHTVPILVFAELGVVGLVLFSLLLASILVQVWHGRNMFAGAIVCALFPMLFLDHWLWTSHFGALFFGFLLGIYSVVLHISQHPTQEEQIQIFQM